MSTNIKYCKPSDEEMTKLVIEWWAKLDQYFNLEKKQVPNKSIESTNGNYAFLYGHYDKKGYPAGSNNGEILANHRDKTIFAPLINGRYGTGAFYSPDVPGEDVPSGIILSQYVTDTYAKIVRENNVIVIPNVHWISHEYPKSHDLINSDFQPQPLESLSLQSQSSESSSNANPGFYYGIWICIDGQQLQSKDVLQFGGKGGPNVAALMSPSNQNLNNVKEWLPRFETHAQWTVL